MTIFVIPPFGIILRGKNLYQLGFQVHRRRDADATRSALVASASRRRFELLETSVGIRGLTVGSLSEMGCEMFRSGNVSERALSETLAS